MSQRNLDTHACYSRMGEACETPQINKRKLLIVMAIRHEDIADVLRFRSPKTNVSLGEKRELSET